MTHIFWTHSVFSNFLHYLEMINSLYLNQEPVDFDTGPDVKFKKKVILLTTFYLFYEIFSRKSFFPILNISSDTYDVIFHSPQLNSKFNFKLVFKKTKNRTILLLTLFENSPYFMKYWQLYFSDQNLQ